jgi:carbonic anhydrase/acetyltransferase-like protein (isoleucine patch superfamily)
VSRGGGGKPRGMLIAHRNARPEVDPSAYVAPNATLCGDVHIGAGARVLFGAVVTAEDGRVVIGERTVVMENALVRGRARTPARIGDDVLIGPHAHVNGAVIDDGAFLATGAAVFPGAVVGANSEVRIHAVVHVNSRLAPGTTVPIGWIAAGDPAELFSPDRHDALWAVQETLDFPGTVYGLPRDATARERMTRQSEWFGAHAEDRVQ